jgi:hypothetical protein
MRLDHAGAQARLTSGARGVRARVREALSVVRVVRSESDGGDQTPTTQAWLTSGARGVSDRGGGRTDRVGPAPEDLGANKQARASGHACAKRYPQSRPFDLNRMEGTRPRALNGCGRRCSSPRRCGRRS